MNNLTPIPRVPSRAPNKNTIEWEIKGRVSICFMLVEKIGYMFTAKVETDKKHWWNSSHKTFAASSSDITELIPKISEFLEQHGYYIDPKTIEFGEVVGFDNQCPFCRSANIKINETENDFLKLKPEGEKAARQTENTTKTYFCWNCGRTWKKTNI